MENELNINLKESLLDVIFKDIDDFVVAYNYTIYDSNIIVQKNIARARCIYSKFSCEKVTDSELFNFYSWYNIYQFNLTEADALKAKEATTRLFEQLKLVPPKLEGLAFTKENIAKCKKVLNKDLVSFDTIASSFENKPTCNFGMWFDNFLENIKNINFIRSIRIHEDFTSLLGSSLEKYLIYSSKGVEALLSLDFTISSIAIISTLAKHKEFSLTAKSITIIEAHINKIVAEHQEDIPDVIRNYADLYFKNTIEKHSYNQKTINQIANAFIYIINDDESDKALLSENLLKTFESIIPLMDNKIAILELLGLAYIRDIYKIDDLTFQHIEVFLSKETYLTNLASEVSYFYLNDQFTKEEVQYAFIEQKVNELLAKHFSLNKQLVKNIITSHVKNIEYFSEALITIIEEYNVNYLNEIEEIYISQGLINFLNNIEALSIKNQKNLIFIISRLDNVRCKLPDNILDKLVIFVQSKNNEIKKLSRKAFHQLKANYLLSYLSNYRLFEEENLKQKSTLSTKEIAEMQSQLLAIAPDIAIENLKNIAINNQDEFDDVFKLLEKYNFKDEVQIKLKCDQVYSYGYCSYLGKSNNFFIFKNYLQKNSEVRIFGEHNFRPTSEEKQAQEHFYNQFSTLSNNILNVFQDSLVISAYYDQNTDKELFSNVIIIKNISEARSVVDSRSHSNNQTILMNLVCLDKEISYPCSMLGKSDNYLQLDTSNHGLIYAYTIDTFTPVIEEEQLAAYAKHHHENLKKIVTDNGYQALNGDISDINSSNETSFTEINQKSFNHQIINQFLDRIISDNEREKQHLLNFILEKKIDNNFLSQILEESDYIENIYTKLAHYIISHIIGSNVELQYHRQFLNLYIERLSASEWTIKNIRELLQLVTEENIDSFIHCLELLSNYSISNKMIDRYGFDALEIMQNNPAETWIDKIWQLYYQNNFQVPYTLDEILAEVAKNNKNNPQTLELVKSGYFKKTIGAIHDAGKKLHYPIKIYYNQEPENYIRNSIQLYSSSGSINLVVDEKKYTINKIDNVEIERLYNILNLAQPIHKDDIQFIYDYFGKNTYAYIDNWKREDYVAWRKRIGVPDEENIAHVMAVLNYATFKTTFKGKYYLRDSQLIAILNDFKAGSSLFQEVPTAEGKTSIINNCVALRVFSGKKVDIITSSKELAVRDADEQKDFYELLGISVGHNIFNAAKKAVYAKDVVYGDLLYFIADMLRDPKDGTRMGRKFSTAYMDEVDNPLIDLNSMTVRLSNRTAGFVTLLKIFNILWGMYPHYVMRDNHCYPGSTEEDPVACIENLKTSLNDFVSEELLNYNKAQSNRPISIPKHLENFAKDQSTYWVDSLVQAIHHSNEREYVLTGNFAVSKNHEKENISYRRVSPISIDTGSINTNQNWEKGLHQFLSLKHNAFLDSENLISLFMSYTSYVTHFKGNIFGFTGTLGGEAHTGFLAKYFDVKFSKVPTFKEKRLVIYPEIIANNQDEWLEHIIHSAETRALKDNRASLIIMETIEEVKLLYSFLSKNLQLNLLLYIYGNEQEREEIENTKVTKNTIVIATNIAGRGTNILPTKMVAALGGMDVIVTFFPSSLRVLLQALARSARGGDIGSAQLIFINKDSDICSNIDCLNKLRDEREARKLENEEYCKLPSLTLQDEYGQKGRNLMLSLQSPTGFDFNLTLRHIPSMLKTGQIYLNGNDTGVYLTALVNHKKQFQKNIDYELASIDQDGYDHIREILYDQESVHFYTKRDLDLIHYIAANYSFFDPKRSIVENVDTIYNNLVTACTIHQNCYIGNIFTESRINYVNNYLVKQDIFNITKPQLQSFKYALWQEYIAQHHYEPELDQVRAHFEMWIYKQSHLFEDFEQKCNASTLKELEELELGLSYQSPFFNELNNKCFVTAELEEAKYSLRNLRQNLENSFEIFASDMKTKFFSKALFNNQKYMQDKALQYHDLYFSELTKASYVKHNDFWDWIFGIMTKSKFMNKAFDYAEDAVQLDLKQAWPQYSVKSIVRVQKAYHAENLRIYDQSTAERCAQIKQKTVDDLYNSLDLAIINRDEYDSSFVVLSSSKQLNASLDLFYQYAITRGALNAYLNATQDAIKFIIDKASDSKVMIKMDKVLTVYDLTESLNVTESISDAAQLHPEILVSLNSSSALSQNFVYANNSRILKDVAAQLNSNYGFVSPVFSTYTLEEEDDIFGKIFVTVFAVVQIVAGFTVLASFGGAGAFFTNSMGLSMIMSGLGDLVMVADSIINDYPMDLDNYFKSKAVNYAVAVITAGLMKGFKIDVLGGAEAFKNGALQKATVFKYALGMQAVSSLVGYAASYGANKIAKSNQGDANSDSESMSNNIVTTYNNQLFVIYMASLLPEYSNLFTNLQGAAYSAANECSKRFNDPAFSIFKQTSSTFVTHAAVAGGGIVGAAIGAVAGTAISSSLGTLKYNEYAGEFDDNYTPYIMNSYVQAETAFKNVGGNKILLQNSLQYEFNDQQVTQIIDQMSKDSFIINNQVNYNNCTGISTLNQTLYSVNLTDVQEICTKVTLGYTQQRESLRLAIKQAIKNGMTSTLSSDVLSPMLNTAGHYIYENVKEWVKAKIEAYEKELRKFAAENELKKLYPEKKEEEKIEAYERGAGGKNKEDRTKQEKKTVEQETKEFKEKLETLKNTGGKKAEVAQKLENKVKEIEQAKKASIMQKTIKGGAEELAKLYDWYVDFSKEYPLLAEYGLSALSIGAKTITGGLPGLAVGVVNEGIGMAVGAAAAPAIEAGLDKTASIYKAQNPLLTDKEAAVLALGTLLVAGNSKTIKIGINKIVGKFKSAHDNARPGMTAKKSYTNSHHTREDNGAHVEADKPTSKKANFDKKNDIPGIDRPFRSENPSFPADHKVVEFMNSDTMKKLSAFEGYDCSEIAEYLLKNANEKGKIIEVKPNKPGTLKLFENGKVNYNDPFDYHQVFTDGKYIYDPRLSRQAVPRGDWETMIKKLNPEGVKISEVH